ncbi:MAG: hypothetical protein N2Z67_04780, partial [Acetobacteraceae bacterium]|nr:hypothetical protein [Acetobacteraceae bacterium]
LVGSEMCIRDRPSPARSAPPAEAPRIAGDPPARPAPPAAAAPRPAAPAAAPQPAAPAAPQPQPASPMIRGPAAPGTLPPPVPLRLTSLSDPPAPERTTREAR